MGTDLASFFYLRKRDLREGISDSFYTTAARFFILSKPFRAGRGQAGGRLTGPTSVRDEYRGCKGQIER